MIPRLAVLDNYGIGIVEPYVKVLVEHVCRVIIYWFGHRVKTLVAFASIDYLARRVDKF